MVHLYGRPIRVGCIARACQDMPTYELDGSPKRPVRPSLRGPDVAEAGALLIRFHHGAEETASPGRRDRVARHVEFKR